MDLNIRHSTVRSVWVERICRELPTVEFSEKAREKSSASELEVTAVVPSGLRKGREDEDATMLEVSFGKMTEI